MGAGDQVGVMAQDLEKSGFKHAVFDTPAGKAVHGAKLALGLAAILPGINERIAKLEKLTAKTDKDKKSKADGTADA